MVQNNKNIIRVFILLTVISVFPFLQSCSSFNYKTYTPDEENDDPEPNYNVTLDEDFQNYTSFMFIGNRIENFGTYFNTYYNAKENYDDAYEDYLKRVLPTYTSRLDNIYGSNQLSQESIDKFNKAIEKASKVIQYHKSSQFIDRSILLIGKSYFYTGDYVKAERKFSEFISKLSASQKINEALLFLSKTQLRLNNTETALTRLDQLIKNSNDREIIAEAYQTLGEYYIFRKNFPAAITNYKKSVEFSSDNEFKSQIQFVIATVIARTNPELAAKEFVKVLDYSPNYDQEFYANFNYGQNLILSNNLSASKSVVEKLMVKYKDNPDFLPQVMLLNARYYDQKKDYKTALKEYLYVLQNFGKTTASSDASYYIGKYYETNQKNYLKALQYYKYSNEESSTGANFLLSAAKTKTLSKYFDLRSIITGKTIKTDYDSLFYKQIKKEDPGDIEKPGEEKKGDNGKGGGYILADSLNETDSLELMNEKIAKAKYELAELFSYELYSPDSSEFYFKAAFEQTENYEFKSRCLFALAVLYKNLDKTEAYQSKLNEIILSYPNSAVSNESRRLLNIPVIENQERDSADSLYFAAETQFTSGNYAGALDGFNVIVDSYPLSKYYRKSIYASGWIYENVLMNSDSSYYYYTKLIESNPPSEYLVLVNAKVEEYRNSKDIKTDSTQIKDTTSSNQQLNNEPKKDNTPELKENKEPVKEDPKIKDDGSIQEVPLKEPKKEDNPDNK